MATITSYYLNKPASKTLLPVKKHQAYKVTWTRHDNAATETFDVEAVSENHALLIATKELKTRNAGKPEADKIGRWAVRWA